MTEQDYMLTAEVAALLRVPSETVRYWRHVGKGPKSFKVAGGRRVLYAREDVEAFIAQSRAVTPYVAFVPTFNGRQAE